MADGAITPRDRARRPRASKRKQGLKLVQFWLPDVRSPEFLAKAKRQSLAVGQSEHEAEEQAWVDSMVDIDSWPVWDPKEP